MNMSVPRLCPVLTVPESLKSLVPQVETISADPTVKLSSAILEKHGEGEVQMISRALVKLSNMLQVGLSNMLQLCRG